MANFWQKILTMAVLLAALICQYLMFFCNSYFFHTFQYIIFDNWTEVLLKLVGNQNAKLQRLKVSCIFSYVYGINLINNPKWIVLAILTIGISNIAKFGIKNIDKKGWQTFGKASTFGNICQIWHHLATLSSGIKNRLVFRIMRN